MNYYRFLYSLRLAWNGNILLGLFHFIRAKYFKIIDFTNNSLPASIKMNWGNFFDKIDSNLLPKIFEISDDFSNGTIAVYQQKIKLSEYTIENYKSKHESEYINDKDTRFHWETYRAKFLFIVGLAYCYTKNQKYASALINYIQNWKKFCPIFNNDIPYNGMEAALKIINLSWCDLYLKNCEQYSDEVRKILAESLVVHAEYIYQNYDISIYGIESNHSLSCSVGLIYTSILFPEHKNSKRWYRFGRRTLIRGLKKQFSDDGVNFESSVQYHRYVFELLILLLAICYRNKIDLAIEIEPSVKKIGNALLALRHTNNLISRFGDSDGGKVLYDTGSIHEFNNLEYLNWFVENNPKQYFETLIFSDIYQFNKFLIKSNSNDRIGNYITYKNSNLSLIISGNRIGTSGKGNHQHNDFLSFELYGKYPFIVDPWAYCYTGDSELRNNDRKTSRHNTIEIDGREIIEFDGSRLFEMSGDIRIKIDDIEEDDSTWSVGFQHDGYKRLKTGSQFTKRKFSVNKKSNSINIIDNLVGCGKHTARMNFLIPKVYWEIDFKKFNEVKFSNDYECFILKSNYQKVQISDNYISELFLNKEDAYQIYFESDYEDKIELHVNLKYQKFSK